MISLLKPRMKPLRLLVKITSVQTCPVFVNSMCGAFQATEEKAAGAWGRRTKLHENQVLSAMVLTGQSVTASHTEYLIANATS